MRSKCLLLSIGLGLIVGSAAILYQLRGRSEKANENGETTKEQFADMTQRPAAARSEEPAPAKPSVAATPKPAERHATTPKPDVRRAANPNTPSPNRQPLGNDELFAPRGADAEFRSLDVKRTGLLTYDEMDDVLRAERERWDTNGDGFIDLDEYRAYYKARTRQNGAVDLKTLLEALSQQQKRAAERKAMDKAKAQQTAAALSTINQSSDLPEAYRQLDTDHDGQIGLYEWKAAGRPIAEFLKKDLNGDGFLTPDELLFSEAGVNGDANPDPGWLTGFQTQIGKRIGFRVTGSANGGVWGSEVYTADSTLAVAAVHAGLLKVGETRTVWIRILEPPPAFIGTTAHGVTTGSFGSFPGAFRFTIQQN